MTERDRQYGRPCFVVEDSPALALEPLPLKAGDDAKDEAWLQRLIHRSPGVLPITQLEPAFAYHEFKAVSREVPTPRGLIDNLLMTNQGDICLVETKLWRNHQARREAVVQALDYATCLFDRGYEAFEEMALAGKFDPYKVPKSLYEYLRHEGPEALAEAEFTDAVADNLRRGRVLILIVGDGIRTEAERLLEGLNDYAQFSFSLGLVEMSLFRLPDGKSILVQPRTLARTRTIVRQVVQIGDKVTVTEAGGEMARDTIDYWSALEGKYPGVRAQLSDFIGRLEPLQVWTDHIASLNLKWDPPDEGRPINLGYIKRDGQVWFDAAAWSAPERPLARAYVDTLVEAFGNGCKVHANAKDSSWSVYRDGRPIRLDVVLPKLDAWEGCIRDFIKALQGYYDSAR